MCINRRDTFAQKAEHACVQSAARPCTLGVNIQTVVFVLPNISEAAQREVVQMGTFLNQS